MYIIIIKYSYLALNPCVLDCVPDVPDVDPDGGLTQFLPLK